MRKMMAQIGKSVPTGLLGKVPGLGKLAGGMPDLAGLDLGALGGAAPNRHAARALRAQAKKDKRRAQKKHKRRGKRR
jgi:hypothetical protein